MKSFVKAGKVACISLIVVLIVLKTVTGAVWHSSSKKQEQSYRMMEEECVNAVKELLYHKGYKDSGVTMTKILLEDGYRDYTITIHHKKINQLPDREREELESEISHLFYSSSSYSFNQEFLKTDL